MASYTGERFSSAALTASGTPGTVSITPASNATAGNTIILVFIYFANSVQTVTSVTDTPGNTWTVDREVTGATSRSVHICSTKQNAGALTTAHTITINLSAAGSGTNHIAWLEEFTGAYSPDVSASQTTGTGTSVTFGTTGTTASSDEFAIVAAVVTKSGASATWTWTKDANYNDFTTAPPLPNASGTVSSGSGYRLLSSTGTQSATYTTNNSTNAQAGCISTYKADAAASRIFFGQQAQLHDDPFSVQSVLNAPMRAANY